MVQRDSFRGVGPQRDMAGLAFQPGFTFGTSAALMNAGSGMSAPIFAAGAQQSVSSATDLFVSTPPTSLVGAPNSIAQRTFTYSPFLADDPFTHDSADSTRGFADSAMRGAFKMADGKSDARMSIATLKGLRGKNRRNVDAYQVSQRVTFLPLLEYSSDGKAQRQLDPRVIEAVLRAVTGRGLRGRRRVHPRWRLHFGRPRRKAEASPIPSPGPSVASAKSGERAKSDAKKDDALLKPQIEPAVHLRNPADVVLTAIVKTSSGRELSSGSHAKLFEEPSDIKSDAGRLASSTQKKVKVSLTPADLPDEKVEAGALREERSRDAAVQDAKATAPAAFVANLQSEGAAVGIFSDVSVAAAASRSKAGGEVIQVLSDEGTQILLSVKRGSDLTKGLPSVKLASVPSIVVSSKIAGVEVKAHYVERGGERIFAGWSKARPSAVALPEIAPHTRWVQDLRDIDKHRVLGAARPGGETAFRQTPGDLQANEVEERFVAMVISQLAMGPESLDELSVLDTFNTFLLREQRLTIGDAITHDEWKLYLKEALRNAISNTPAFDENGLRPITAIQDDAASVLKMNVDAFYGWEQALELETLTSQLFDKDLVSSALPEAGVKRDLLEALTDGIAMRALMTLDVAYEKGVVLQEEETRIQWDVVWASMIPDSSAKIEFIKEHLSEIVGIKGGRLAGRALSLLIAHSELENYRDADDAFAPLWTRLEVEQLFKTIMTGDTWSVASHRSFRRHLTPEQNRAVNEIISRANYEMTVEPLRELDVNDESTFWAAVDDIGSEAVTDFVFQKILMSVGN